MSAARYYREYAYILSARAELAERYRRLDQASLLRSQARSAKQQARQAGRLGTQPYVRRAS